MDSVEADSEDWGEEGELWREVGSEASDPDGGGGLYVITISSTTICLRHHSYNKNKFMPFGT